MKRPTTTRARWATLLVAGALAMTACADTEGDSDGDSAEGGSESADQSLYSTGVVNVEDAGEPVQGGTLRVVEYSEARTLNPTQTYATGPTGLIVMASVYDTLMRFDSESNGYEPQLAESLESDDDTVWTLTLREGVEFTDGTPLDAEAVKASLEYYLESYGFRGNIIQDNLESMEVTDERTLTFTFNAPWATFPNLLAAGPGLIMAPAAYKNPEKFEPIGAGPFTLESMKPGEKTTVTANEDYFDGRPNLDSVEFVVLNTDQTRFDSLQAGEADMVYLRQDDIVKQAFDEGLPGAVTVVSGTRILNLNAAEGSATGDVRVRQAINLALSADTWMERVTGDTSLANRELMDSFSQWNTDVAAVEQDAEAAKTLVEEAKADGFDGEVRYLAGSDSQSQAGAVATKAMLESVGFSVTLDLASNVADQVQKVYVDRDFDIATGSTSIQDNDPYSALYSSLNSASPTNPGSYANPELDELLNELKGAASPEDGMETMAAIEEIWTEDVPYVNISGGSYFNVWADNVHGVQQTTETSVLLDEAWIEQ